MEQTHPTTHRPGPKSQVELLRQLAGGDHHALAELFALHRDRLLQVVHARLDRRLAVRVDAEDVLQEVYLDASKRISHFMEQHSGSLFVWLRLVALQTMADIHRRHVGAQMRDVTREHSIFQAPSAGGSPSTAMALQLLGKLTSPSQAAMREETARQLEEAIQSMSAIDREVLMLRHFEQLDNREVAEVLDIKPKAASIRYIRALVRLRALIADIPGLQSE